MMANAVFIQPPGAARYKFNEQHPFNPLRLRLAIDLLQELDALKSEDIIEASPASETLLSLIHRSDYLEAVKQLSLDPPPEDWVQQAQRYGLQTEDTPYFPGMHEAASAIVGGSVLAADLVMSGKTLHAYHMGGGLHHAFPDRGSGFCVYNDAAIAIAHIRKKYDVRVLYIDTDVHHGDGVQWSFYDESEVCTYSIHETGKFLFPGTGFVQERGAEHGFGSNYNVPVDPYTEDDSWLESFTASIRKVAAAFKPDIIVSQHGCDAHAFDPLSHTHCSMRIYREMPAIIHSLAHEHAQGRWVAVGGGGYDIWRVVPRAWALVWLEMTDHPISSTLAASDANEPLPAGWLERYSSMSPEPLPTHWMDDTRDWPPIPRRAEIESSNRRISEIVVQDL
ncbi:acetoin utilization protein AcuC [Paenibacillus nasutitermitis]|uniref:Acetoin utilization protein AcuC n=1 Tax=Paenibacillus nasutitermitis TaxID=1652958 RepID=A0A917DTE1_9BACL|nr:acetoin utilization protein AcuC [Paenibacillus nasutitermitis]GGD65299.1 acetoin utilization protein AcuC [Paenibacillus nasutitermitis]